VRLGAVADGADLLGSTPLISVARKGDAETIRLLLGLGADATRRGPSGGISAVGAAKLRGRRDAELLGWLEVDTLR
jgi:ankyrin repeat protein